MTRLTLIFGVLCSCAAAQPPNVIRVIRNGSIQPYVDVGPAVNVLGMSSVSGFSETWLIEIHDSFGSLEDVDRALSTVTPAGAGARAASPDDLLTQSKSLVGTYIPGLSYHPDQAIQILPKTRYMDVVIYRIRPGTEDDFGKFLRLRSHSLESTNLDRPDIVYRVMSGDFVGTYIVLSPLPSLRVFDNGRAATPVYAEGEQALARKIAADAELVRERLWFRIDPRLSYVSDEFASADAGFWHPAAK